jgi:hypothetical protein
MMANSSNVTVEIFLRCDWQRIGRQGKGSSAGRRWNLPKVDRLKRAVNVQAGFNGFDYAVAAIPTKVI